MKKYIITLIVLFIGCASNKQDEEYDLLHRDGLLAYKSITIKDIIGEKDFN